MRTLSSSVKSKLGLKATHIPALKKMKKSAGPGRARDLSDDGEGSGMEVAHITSVHIPAT